MTRNSLFGRLNLPLLLCAALLCGLGLFALWMYDDGGRGIFKRQVVWVGVGSFVLFAALTVPFRFSRPPAYVLYALGLAALLALLVFARHQRGARGWFEVGPIKVQPAEFMKILLVLALARWLSYARDLQRWRGLAVPVVLAVVPMALVAAQPDLGNAMLFIPVLLSMLYVAGAKGRHLGILLAVLLAAAPVVYGYGLKEYQRNRLISFLWPEKSRDLSYQQTQSQKACAAGGVTGNPEMTRGVRTYVIPDRHTDFVFSILAEETGFAGATALLLLFAAFFFQAGRIACATRDPYGRLLVVGLSLFLALQVFVNIGMAIGVAPITGLTLPFVSYGGSSLVTCFLATGLILNVGARVAPSFSRRDLDAGHVAIHDFVPQPTKWLGA